MAITKGKYVMKQLNIMAKKNKIKTGFPRPCKGCGKRIPVRTRFQLYCEACKIKANRMRWARK